MTYVTFLGGMMEFQLESWVLGALCGVAGASLAWGSAWTLENVRSRRGRGAMSVEITLLGGPWDGRSVLVTRGPGWVDADIVIQDSPDIGRYLIDWSEVRAPKVTWRQGQEAAR